MPHLATTIRHALVRPTTYMRTLNLSVLPRRQEKEGIPAEYLRVVDVCVEIPQLGVIRSLNVHVSGAIMCWEYARQHEPRNK